MEGFAWLPFGCFKPPYDNLYLVRDAINWGLEHDFECRQSMNIKGRRFIEWHNPKMFVIPPRGRDVFYQAVYDVWDECKISLVLGILTPVLFLYMTDKAES